MHIYSQTHEIGYYAERYAIQRVCLYFPEKECYSTETIVEVGVLNGISKHCSA